LKKIIILFIVGGGTTNKRELAEREREESVRVKG